MTPSAKAWFEQAAANAPRSCDPPPMTRAQLRIVQEAAIAQLNRAITEWAAIVAHQRIAASGTVPTDDAAPSIEGLASLEGRIATVDYGYAIDASDQALMDAIAEGFGLTPTEETEDERKERIWRALQEAARV